MREPDRIARIVPDWNRPLDWPITLSDGSQLHSLSDVRAFVLGLSEEIQRKATWERVADLLISAAERVDRVHELTVQMEEALFFEGRLQVG
jgi:hypothetical protein